MHTSVQQSDVVSLSCTVDDGFVQKLNVIRPGLADVLVDYGVFSGNILAEMTAELWEKLLSLLPRICDDSQRQNVDLLGAGHITQLRMLRKYYLEKLMSANSVNTVPEKKSLCL